MRSLIIIVTITSNIRTAANRILDKVLLGLDGFRTLGDTFLISLFIVS
ncbi:MAG: hypothetical protein WC496_02345 [Phycisphaerae bacterium]